MPTPFVTTRFTPNDLAKYPFLKETAEYLKKLGLDIEELTSPELGAILNRAEERIEKAVLSVSTGQKHGNDVEIPSFPVAIMLAIDTKNSFIKKRYALAEAKQAFYDLQLEPTERFLAIARDFGWTITANEDKIPFNFSVKFTDYLKNASHLRDNKWKLVNRPLVKGQVYLDKHDAARLLQEEIQRRIEKSLDAKDLPAFPQKIIDIANHLNTLAKDHHLGEQGPTEFPKDVAQSAFPPCVVSLYHAAVEGRHLSHIGRFTLTAFLATIGMPTEKIAEVFKTSSDYNERLTLYQVEHIAGARSGTRYTPPSCSTLQTHGVCINDDNLCRRIHHPLSYYRRKMLAGGSK